jgi:hypothetical protein
MNIWLLRISLSLSTSLLIYLFPLKTGGNRNYACGEDVWALPCLLSMDPTPFHPLSQTSFTQQEARTGRRRRKCKQRRNKRAPYWATTRRRLEVGRINKGIYMYIYIYIEREREEVCDTGRQVTKWKWNTRRKEDGMWKVCNECEYGRKRGDGNVMTGV